MAAPGTACGPEATVCNTRIYPKEVIKTVRQQMKSLVLDPNLPVQVPKNMELDDTMKAANWKDAAVSLFSFQLILILISRVTRRKYLTDLFFVSLFFSTYFCFIDDDDSILFLLHSIPTLYYVRW